MKSAHLFLAMFYILSRLSLSRFSVSLRLFGSEFHFHNCSFYHDVYLHSFSMIQRIKKMNYIQSIKFEYVFLIEM